MPRYVVMEHAEWVSGRRAGGPKSSDPMVQVSFGLDHDCVGATRIAARGSESIDRSDVAALSLSDMDHPFWQERERKAMEVARAVIKAQEDANPVHMHSEVRLASARFQDNVPVVRDVGMRI